MENINITRAPLFLALIFVMPSASSAEPQTKLEQKTTTYSVGLSATRLIYTPGSPVASVTINNLNDFPALAQSEVSPDDGGSRVQFSVTTPLFRSDAGQQTRACIIMTGDSSAKDRESINWFCVTGIPPEKGDVWDERNYFWSDPGSILKIKG
uniref:F1 capsule protein n=1 Tax=Enterobacter cloacae TaxID=550 RepID=A0A4P8GLC5_ENTCL|nr:fimbria/pilus periplasmic chaperone [Enterobacter cloacae]QCO95809.1 F1 capsule protein [Enterobacter cloacae]